jgi:two-component system, NtrC family, response regulator PilR
VADIVVVDDERSMREFLQILLERDSHQVRVAAGVKEAIAVLTQQAADLVFTDLRLTDGSGMEVLQWLRDNSAETQVIMMTAYATAENAVEAMRLGAYDYQIKPFKVSEVRALTQKALEKVTLLRDNATLRAQLKRRLGTGRLLGRSAGMLAVIALIEKVAPGRTSVLVEGESGTGKELVARAIHEASPRADGPFVAVNCGAIAESLIETELFGHVAGAFTGAVRARPGMFESAHGGTLLLDEVSSLPAAMQVKLLRVLQERSVRRVGEEHERPIDVRIVAATNQSLQDMVHAGTFREDLFYRLNVVHIVVPPLRERSDDIPLLARALTAKHADDMHKHLDGIAADAMRALVNYDFPGNVRELENYMERAVTLATGALIRLEDLPAELKNASTPRLADPAAFPDEGITLERVLADLERRFIEEALRRANNVKTHAAELLGLSFRSLRYRMQKLGMGDASDAGAAANADEQHED